MSATALTLDETLSLTAKLQAAEARAVAAADLIETLSAERDGLAAIVLAKDEALKSCSPTLTFAACRKVDAALALPLPEAVAQVQEWQFKAANWDAYCKSEFGESTQAKEAENAN